MEYAGQVCTPDFGLAMSLPTPDDVLDFWFTSARDPEPRFDIWFKKRDETDQLIREKFEALVTTLASGHAYDWSAMGAKQTLAAIIALDQFPRNIYRGTPKAFASDHLALSLASNMMVMGSDHRLSLLERWFVYMPLEHAESRTTQRASVAAFTELRDAAPAEHRTLFADALDYAHKHAEVIERFGRFPHRNEILGRTSTPEELTWLEENGGF